MAGGDIKFRTSTEGTDKTVSDLKKVKAGVGGLGKEQVKTARGAQQFNQSVAGTGKAAAAAQPKLASQISTMSTAGSAAAAMTPELRASAQAMTLVGNSATLLSAGINPVGIAIGAVTAALPLMISLFHDTEESTRSAGQAARDATRDYESLASSIRETIISREKFRRLEEEGDTSGFNTEEQLALIQRMEAQNKGLREAARQAQIAAAQTGDRGEAQRAEELHDIIEHNKEKIHLLKQSASEGDILREEGLSKEKEKRDELKRIQERMEQAKRDEQEKTASHGVSMAQQQRERERREAEIAEKEAEQRQKRREQLHQQHLQRRHKNEIGAIKRLHQRAAELAKEAGREQAEFQAQAFQEAMGNAMQGGREGSFLIQDVREMDQQISGLEEILSRKRELLLTDQQIAKVQQKITSLQGQQAQDIQNKVQPLMDNMLGSIQKGFELAKEEEISRKEAAKIAIETFLKEIAIKNMFMGGMALAEAIGLTVTNPPAAGTKYLAAGKHFAIAALAGGASAAIDTGGAGGGGGGGGEEASPEPAGGGGQQGGGTVVINYNSPVPEEQVGRMNARAQRDAERRFGRAA